MRTAVHDALEYPKLRMRRMRQTQVHRDRIAEGIAAAGAGMIAPPGMRDGRVGVIRAALDENGCGGVPIARGTSRLCQP
jgi:hypothetical protein